MLQNILRTELRVKNPSKFEYFSVKLRGVINSNRFSKGGKNWPDLLYSQNSSFLSLASDKCKFWIELISDWTAKFWESHFVSIYCRSKLTCISMQSTIIRRLLQRNSVLLLISNKKYCFRVSIVWSFTGRNSYVSFITPQSMRALILCVNKRCSVFRRKMYRSDFLLKIYRFKMFLANNINIK